MMQNSYDIEALISQSAQWRLEAERSTLASRRAFCLGEAARYDRMVQRSIAVPVIEGVAITVVSSADAGSVLIEYPGEVTTRERAGCELDGKPAFVWVKPSKAR
jgi:hypothetical protein